MPSVLIFIKEPLRAYAIWGGAYAQVYFGNGNNPDFVSDVLKDMKHDMMIQGLLDVIKTPDMVFLLPLILVSSVVLITRWKKGMDKTTLNTYLLLWLIFTGIVWLYSKMYANYLGYVNQVVLFAIPLSIPIIEAITNRITPKKMAMCAIVFMIAAAGFYHLHFQKRLKTSIFYMFNSKEQIITPGFVNNI